MTVREAWPYEGDDGRWTKSLETTTTDALVHSRDISRRQLSTDFLPRREGSVATSYSVDVDERLFSSV